MALASQLRDLVELHLVTLTAQHVRLARVELAADAKFVGTRIGVIAALAPLVLVGYGFLCVALAYALQRVVAPDLAFLIVGLLNLLGGVIGILLAVKQLQGARFSEQSLTELEATSALVVRAQKSALVTTSTKSALAPVANSALGRPAPATTPSEVKAELAATRERARAQLAALEAEFDGLGQWREFVRRRPAVAVASAFAVGYVLGRLLSRGRS